MIYKSPKEMYQKTYQNLQENNPEAKVSQEEVDKFGEFFFTKLNGMISSLEHLEVYVPKLGSFKFRRKKANEYTHLHRSKPANLLPLSYTRDPEVAAKIIEGFNVRYEKLQNLIERHEEMIKDRKTFKEKVNGVIKNQGDIQQSEADMGGTEE